MSSMSKSTEFGPLQFGIVALAIATGIIHLFILGVRHGDVLFILNGLGYLVLLAGVYLPLEFLTRYRSLARWILMGYTALTIVLYFVMTPNIGDPLGLITKAIEVILIVLLWIDRENV